MSPRVRRSQKVSRSTTWSVLIRTHAIRVCVFFCTVVSATNYDLRSTDNRRDSIGSFFPGAAILSGSSTKEGTGATGAIGAGARQRRRPDNSRFGTFPKVKPAGYLSRSYLARNRPMQIPKLFGGSILRAKRQLGKTDCCSGWRNQPRLRSCWWR